MQSPDEVSLGKLEWFLRGVSLNVMIEKILKGQRDHVSLCVSP